MIRIISVVLLIVAEGITVSIRRRCGQPEFWASPALNPELRARNSELGTRNLAILPSATPSAIRLDKLTSGSPATGCL